MRTKHNILGSEANICGVPPVRERLSVPAVFIAFALSAVALSFFLGFEVDGDRPVVHRMIDASAAAATIALTFTSWWAALALPFFYRWWSLHAAFVLVCLGASAAIVMPIRSWALEILTALPAL